MGKHVRARACVCSLQFAAEYEYVLAVGNHGKGQREKEGKG